jgi:hypothetical protein
MNFFILNLYFYFAILAAIRLGDWLGMCIVVIAYWGMLSWLDLE